MAIFSPLKSAAPAQAEASRPAYILSFALLVTAFFIAGGARDDLVSLLLWRPLSMVLLALSVALCWRAAWNNAWVLLIFALAVVALPVLQLIPLPPAIWTALPGRDLITGIFRDAGMALPWQPLSVAQARTWNALFSLAAPLALFVAALSLHQHWQRRLLILLIILGFVSGIIGVVQAIGPTKGPLYFYRITNNGLSVGLFANRNHQAMFMAMIYPLLAANLSFFKGKPDQLLFRRAITIAGGMLLLPLILMTGSRAGLILAFVGMGAGWWVYKSPLAQTRAADRQADRRVRLVIFGMITALILVVMVVVLRTPAIQRLIGTDPAGELRISALPYVFKAVGDYMPFGSGLGTFVEVYQIYEPDKLISAQYFNHAHNDFVELLLTTGLPGVLLMLVAGSFALVSLRSLHQNRGLGINDQGFAAQMLGRAGFSILTMLALSSVADYPLRVPSLMLLGITAAAWCAAAYRSAKK